jgi:hypothetical protein
MAALKLNSIACGQCLGFYIDYMHHQIGEQKTGLAVSGNVDWKITGRR